jgi:regulator of sigma E protease
MKTSAGKPVSVTFVRAGKTHTLLVEPAFSAHDGPARWMLGLGLENRMTETRLSPVEALRASAAYNWKNGALIARFLGGLFSGRVPAQALSGPIGMARLSGDAARRGVPMLVWITALIALNLALVNLLPLPVLDGGLMAILAVEMVLRRDLSHGFKRALSHLGIVLLAALLAFAVFNDLSRILPG